MAKKASDEIVSGDLDDSAGKRVIYAINRANQPREFKIRGRWVRWEPAGQNGSIQEISEDEMKDGEFAVLLVKYFQVREATE